MYKKCKTLKSSERQKEFEQTLLDMFERVPFSEITVVALCKEMEVPRKAFYRYFNRIEDVLDALMDEMLYAAFFHMEIKVELEKLNKVKAKILGASVTLVPFLSLFFRIKIWYNRTIKEGEVLYQWDS